MKRIISILLSILMIFCSLPLTVSAANIGRKALPELFTQVSFEKPDILTNIFNM